jgi:hypothetical protein
MKNTKLNMLIMNVELNTDHFKLTNAGNHNLTLTELKDTIFEALEAQLEEFEKKMIESGGKFDSGVLVLPLLKVNFKNE